MPADNQNHIQSAWKIIPHFHSPNIQATVHFYTSILGFTVGGIHTDDQSGQATFCSLYAGDKAAANIYFSSSVSQASSAWIALGTEELDEFYRVLKTGGVAEIVEDIGDREWGYRQFSVKDVDGNKLTFFRFLEGGNPGGEGE